jgi:hydroxymethylpyrimidine pyrophosphatase-like HAD family hydrolase
MLVGLDFDGTIVKNKYPGTGDDLGAIPWLKKAAKMGVKFILFTMRDGKQLEEAVKYLTDRGIKLHATNCNPDQWKWTMSPKVYCQLYVDDNALGAPVDVNHDVDWNVAGPALLRAIETWKGKHPGGKQIKDAGRYEK